MPRSRSNNNLGVTRPFWRAAPKAGICRPADPRIKAAAAVALVQVSLGRPIAAKKPSMTHCDCMMPTTTYGIDLLRHWEHWSRQGIMIATYPVVNLLLFIEAVHSIYHKNKTNLIPSMENQKNFNYERMLLEGIVNGSKEDSAQNFIILYKRI